MNYNPNIPPVVSPICRIAFRGLKVLQPAILPAPHCCLVAASGGLGEDGCDVQRPWDGGAARDGPGWRPPAAHGDLPRPGWHFATAAQHDYTAACPPHRAREDFALCHILIDPDARPHVVRVSLRGRCYRCETSVGAKARARFRATKGPGLGRLKSLWWGM